MNNRSLPSLVAAALLLTGTGSAQIQTIAKESFDYPYPGLLHNRNGGTGWATPWQVLKHGNEIVIFENNPQHPPFAGTDGVGNFAGQANGYGEAYREPQAAGHGDVTDNGKFGKDGAALWLTFNVRTYQVFGDHFGGLSLFDGSAEQLLIGSPWGSYGWGIDPKDGSGGTVAPGSDDSVDVTLVCRIDYLPGMERARLWVIRAGKQFPKRRFTLGPADVDIMVADHRWDRIRFSSGGAGSHQYWDGLEIAKGSDDCGTPYCGASQNPANSALIAIDTCESAASSINVGLSNGPPDQFVYLLVGDGSNTIAQPPGATGDLCVSGGSCLGRYDQDLGKISAGGTFNIDIKNALSNPCGGAVSIAPGATWNFQYWHRQPKAPSTFSQAISVTFN